MTNDLSKQQEKEILEVLYELFPSMRNAPVNFVQVPNALRACSTPNESAQDRAKYEQHLVQQANAQYNPVTKPSHYNQHGVEAIQAIEASMSSEEFKGYLKGSVMKYVWRYTYKGKAVEDLEKAQVYLGWLIERVKNVSK